MSFFFWNIKYVNLPTIFEVALFARVSKYRILSSSFRFFIKHRVLKREHAAHF